ncbi:YnjH family protein [Erwinia sp.]|uniref:YnjH family protein n=1 Tax=Erwinia citreus TaxID=558 RepID=UPI00289CBD8C|nr:YnjH family protein [Erwinia sp.]
MHLSTGHNDYEQDREPVQSGGANADVMVDMPPEVWTQGQNNQPPCLRCCTYQNRSYTEGSVVKMEGVLLQCSRDEKSYGTNNLIWQTVK